jgi:NAD(P)-dependent dehydrogenase (short-subunit alcohol dehydrogenase family)
MKKSRAVLRTAHVVTGIVAAAATYALLPRTAKRGRSGKVVLITGGSRGLGFALAERYGRSGARLVLAARDLTELTRARNSLLFRKAVQSPDDILLVPANLTDAGHATHLIEQAITHFGRIDILINNAGVIEVGPVEDQTIAAYRRAMATNFFAALYTTHAALPHLLGRKPGTGDAAIVNIASIGGKFAMPHMLPYVASKFALVGFSEGLHAELRHKGIRVTTVCPGLMRTGGEAHANYTGQIKKERRWFNLAAKTPGIATSVQHAANKIYDAVAAGRAEITITPQAWLAARMAGIAPSTTQYLASLANQLLLPAPAPANHFPIGFTLKVSTHIANETLDQDETQETDSITLIQ